MKPAIKLITPTLFLLLAACGGGSEGSSLLFPSSGQVVNLPPQVVEPLTTPMVPVVAPEPVVVAPDPVVITPEPVTIESEFEPEIEVVIEPEPEPVVVTPEPVVQPEPEVVVVTPEPSQNLFRVDNWFDIFEEYNTTDMTRIVEDYTRDVVNTLDARYFQVSSRTGQTVEFTINGASTVGFDNQGFRLSENVDSVLFSTSCGTSLFSGNKRFFSQSTYMFDEDFNFDRNCDVYSGGLRVTESGGTAFSSGSSFPARTFFIGADFTDSRGNRLTGGYSVEKPEIAPKCVGCIKDAAAASGGFSAIEIGDLCISNTNVARSIVVNGVSFASDFISGSVVESYDSEFTTFCDGTTVAKTGSHTTTDEIFLGQIEVTITATNGEQIRITDFADPNTQTEVLINGSERVRSNIVLTGHIANTTPTFNR